jgi:hypothetical protein
MSITIDKISALLHQAENTENEHEAEAFLLAAQKLATIASIDLAVARSHQANKLKRATPIRKVINTGVKGKHGLKEYVKLALAIAAVNDVDCDVRMDSTAVIAYGFESDIEVVEALFASLLFQMEAACHAFIKSGAFKEDGSETYNHRTGEWSFKPVHGNTARKNFQIGFVNALSLKLHLAKSEARLEAVEKAAEEENTSTSESSTAIVLRAKATEVKDFYKAQSNARGSWKGGKGPSYYAENSRAAGRTAGQKANIGGQRALGGSRTAIG